MREQLINLNGNQKIFYVTTAYPPVPAGSSIINRNLLSKFNPNDFRVFSTKTDISAKVESFGGVNVERIFKSFYFSSKLNYVLSNLQLKKAISKVITSAEKFEPEVIVGVYPDYYFLKIAYEAAKHLQVPFVAYLHDTIIESSQGSRFEKLCKELQEDTFRDASALLVMSEGMRDLYSHKYGIQSIPLQHTYLEEIPDRVEKADNNRQAFWGGDVYAINQNSVNRITDALLQNSCRFFIASGHDKSYFERIGLNTDNIDLGFFSKREEYLRYLKNNSILVLALDWPDESKIHFDELATIFPTKTPEYLASGIPIIVHCPEEYFMARFFKENDCGYVVSSRDINEIQKIIRKILDDPEHTVGKRLNALKTAHIFDSNLLANKFASIIRQVSSLKWTEKIDYATIKH